MALDLQIPEDDQENHLNKGALWAIIYGDLMSYLMLFFLLMFSFSVSDENTDFVESLSEVQQAFGGEANKELIERKAAEIKEEAQGEEMKKRFSAPASESFANVEMNEEKIKITFREGILFQTGAAELAPGADKVLHEVADFMREMPNQIVIEGHTDNIAIPKGSKYVSNWVLSMARAYRVLTYFAEVEKIAPQRLAAAGYGEYQPIADNATPEGRGQNRRIEITLIRK